MMPILSFLFVYWWENCGTERTSLRVIMLVCLEGQKTWNTSFLGVASKEKRGRVLFWRDRVFFKGGVRGQRLPSVFWGGLQRVFQVLLAGFRGGFERQRRRLPPILNHVLFAVGLKDLAAFQFWILSNLFLIAIWKWSWRQVACFLKNFLAASCFDQKSYTFSLFQHCPSDEVFSPTAQMSNLMLGHGYLEYMITDLVWNWSAALVQYIHKQIRSTCEFLRCRIHMV